MSAGCRQEGGRGTLVREAKRQEGTVAWAQAVGKTSWTGKAPWKIRFIQFGFVLGSPGFSEVSAIRGWGAERSQASVFGGSQYCSEQCLEAGRLGCESQFLHFVALWA